MSQWDWIQWYYFITMSFSVAVSLFLHGVPKVGQHDFRYTFISLILAIPGGGRIFGWW